MVNVALKHEPGSNWLLIQLGLSSYKLIIQQQQLTSSIVFLIVIWLSYKDWELLNSRVWLAEIDFDRSLDFPN